MLNSRTLWNLIWAAWAAALCGTAPGVSAHTTIRDQATEGTAGYNALQIGHGCEDDATGKRQPVIAQSVVFPTQNPKVTRPDPNDPSKTVDIPLSDIISDPLGLAGKAALVQDRNIFTQQDVVSDANGNVIGFHGTEGHLQANLLGLVPFQFTPPSFVPSDATHCAKRLLIKVAVADLCTKAFPPKPGTANLWIPNATPTFADGSIDGSSPDPLGGAPATLTVNRKDPLDPACGDGYDVTVWPSDEDVDAHLPIPGYWGK